MKDLRIRYVRLLMCSLVLVLALPVCGFGSGIVSESAAATGERDAGTVVSLLSYNVHGLFTLIAKDRPRDRMPTIGWLAKGYDVVLFQEDFEYHDTLRAQLEHHFGVVGKGMGWDPRRVGARLLIFPLSLVVPHFSPPYGTGLSTFVRSELARPDDVGRGAYRTCYDWLGPRGDCWARKGYLRATLTTPGGSVDVYNTHLSAGRKPEAVAARGRQLETLAEAIEARSTDRAIIVAGDFNVSFNRAGDDEVMRRFRRRLRLVDSGAGPALASWRERDYILYRGSSTTSLSVEKSGEAGEFVKGRRALSDHAALYARFRVQPAQAGAR